MSKHAIDDDIQGDFWKKVKYGAAAAVTLGSGLFAATSVLKNQGFFNMVDEVKTAMQTTPRLIAGTPSNPTAHPDDETREVLNMQLGYAMQHQDTYRVQEISRQLDELQATNVTTNVMTQASMPVTVTQMQVPQMPQMHPQAQMQVPQMPQMPQMHPQAQMQVPQMPQMHPQAQMQVPQMPQMHPQAQMQVPQMPQMRPQAQMQVPQMPQMHPQAEMQVPQMQADTPSFDETSRDTAPPKVSRQPSRKPAEQTPRQLAMQKLQAGDIVEATDPVTTTWSPATIRAIAKNGLVEVLWDDPGTDDNGKPFHPIGEVWAEQIRLQYRPAPAAALAPQKAAAPVEEEPVTPPDGLQVGDACFAMGQVVAKTWFAAKLIGVRARSPPMRVEYTATLDGQTAELLLPSPRKDYVNLDQIRRDKPEVESSEMSRRAALEEKEAKALEVQEAKALEVQEAKAVEQASQNDPGGDTGGDAGGGAEDDLVISPDLMCAVCERPDDEPNMLVCDCTKGYHIYCLSPPLEKVPEGDWMCPTCAKKK